MTSIWNVQLPLAGTVPPAKVTLPTLEVTAPPVQLVPLAGVVARNIPVPGVVGKVSVTLATVIGPLFGLAIVMMSVDVPPDAIVAGVKTLAMVGATAVTVKLAVLDGAPVTASLLETPVVVFGKMPGVLLLTTMDTVQLPLPRIVRPLILIKPVWLTV